MDSCSHRECQCDTTELVFQEHEHPTLAFKRSELRRRYSGISMQKEVTNARSIILKSIHIGPRASNRVYTVLGLFK
jgi:hypothetical protein